MSYNMGDYNRAGYTAFIFSMGFTMIFFVYIAFIHPGVDLNEIKAPVQKEQQKEVPSATSTTEPGPTPGQPREEPKK